VILRALDEHVCPTTALPCTTHMRSRFDLPSGEHPAQPAAQNASNKSRFDTFAA
jgi:hypothetical protein